MSGGILGNGTSRLGHVDSGGRLLEAAPAKINLTLQVLGRRDDGYHSLQSLVAFAEFGDTLSLRAAGSTEAPASLAIAGGTFASAIDAGDNLVLEAVTAARAVFPVLIAGHFELTKNIPVAAGLGGGSADAGAALRLLQRANPSIADHPGWRQIARAIGADVPVCLDGRPSIMAGIGERLLPVAGLADCWVVLANPRVQLATSSVFQALAAPAVATTDNGEPSPPKVGSFPELIQFMAGAPNDLQPAAAVLCPAIAEVCGRLSRLTGAKAARMSGSGATCFAMFEHANTALAAATALAAGEPTWWVQAARLRSR